MNRRSLLRMLGLAPVAACSAALPAIALPKPENVKDIVSAGTELHGSSWSQSEMFIDASQAGPSRLVIDYDVLVRDVENASKWTSESIRYVLAELDRIKNV